MADRLFAGLFLLVAAAYSVIAFSVIEAPFQYDPLGPESWPRILGVLACLCCFYLLARPDDIGFSMKSRTLLRLAAVVALLLGYAALYEPAGFVLSTWAFAGIFAVMLGASPLHGLIFGAATGIVGYLLCTLLLELNLPAGLLEPLL